jgi:hypothetical protein
MKILDMAAEHRAFRMVDRFIARPMARAFLMDFFNAKMPHSPFKSGSVRDEAWDEGYIAAITDMEQYITGDK